MPAKSIAELSAGSNLVANIAPVADPVTGVAGKSSISSLTYSTTNPLSIFTNLSSVGTQCGLSAISVNGAIIAIENNIEGVSGSGMIDPSIGINGSLAITPFLAPFSLSSLTINSYVFQGITASDTTLLNDTCTILVPNAIISVSGSGVVSQIDNQAQLTEKTIAYPSMKQWITNPGNAISPSYYDWNFSAPELLQLGYFSISKFVKSISIPKCNLVLQFQEAAGQTTTSLKSLSFPLVKYIGTTSFQDKNDWEVFDMPELVAVTVDGSPFARKPCPNLLTFNYPKLEAIFGAGNGVAFPAKAGFSFTLPALETIGYNSTNVNFVFPASGTSGYIGFPTDLAATGSGNYSISLPSLKKVTSSNVTVGAGSAQMSFYGTGTYPGPLCNSLNIGTGLTNVTGGIYIVNQPLNQASVDNLLVSYANLDGTGGKTLYNGTMPSITITGPASAPSATGLTAKSTLVARGVTVTTN